MTCMPDLFEPFSIKGMQVKNRFVRSATWEGLAERDGMNTSRLNKLMAELAKNEAGLIISSYAFVSPNGQSTPWQLAIYDDRFIDGLEKMADAVHTAGGKIAMQLVHGGRFSSFKLTKEMPMGPSLEEKKGQLLCRQMSKKDISRVVNDFTDAAIRAKKAGFDAIQLHGAHGFLLHQFLSPAFNRRTDEYGGILENRARLLLEVVRMIRDAAGTMYPILIKLSSEDFLEKGLTREEIIDVAEMLKKASIDAIELSGGTLLSKSLVPSRPGELKTRDEEVYYKEAARLYRQRQGLPPLILVGGIRSFEVAEELVKSGLTDLISLSRPLIAEPDLIKRWHEGDRRKAKCISCNRCFGPPRKGKGLYCVTLNENKDI